MNLPVLEPDRFPDMASGSYLDAASSEPLHPAARDAYLAAVDQGYADPRRLHRAGRSARLLLDNARAAVAEALAVRTDEVSFTSSGTAAVHLGLLGLHRGARDGGRIAYSAVEHSAVLHAVTWAGGGEELPVDAVGRVAVAPPPPGTSVLAVQSANHEVGTVQPVAEMAAAAGAIPVFSDACASAGRLPLPEGWSAAAASAHKWGGPAGVGVLLVRKGARWRHPFPVDERIDERVPGFENVPAALAAAAALQAVVAEREELRVRQHALVARIRAAAARIPDVDVVGDPDDRLAHLVTFSCLYVDGESLVTELDRLGFGVASGSACTASTLTPSHVLAAMGALTHGNVRVSLTRDTTEADVDEFLKVLPGIVGRLRAEVGR
jgi:cysteine desulfurase